MLQYLSRKINQVRFMILNRGLTHNQIALSKDITLNIHPDTYYPFRYFTDFDTDMVTEMRSFIKFTKGKKCFLDVGSYWGIFSLVFSSNSDTISFAVEPSPLPFEKLENHQHLNPQCRIEAFQLALGDSEGKLQMECDSSNHFIVTNRSKLEEIVEVDVITIDNFISKHNIVPDVIKIDTEGFELNVLRGAANFLNQNNPMIFLEVHPTFLKQLGYSVEELMEFLSGSNYKIYDSNLNLISNPLSYLSQEIRRVICCKLPE